MHFNSGSHLSASIRWRWATYDALRHFGDGVSVGVVVGVADGSGIVEVSDGSWLSWAAVERSRIATRITRSSILSVQTLVDLQRWRFSWPEGFLCIVCDIYNYLLMSDLEGVESVSELLQQHLQHDEYDGSNSIMWLWSLVFCLEINLITIRINSESEWWNFQKRNNQIRIIHCENMNSKFFFD